jgi:hypothetical protein
MIEQGDTGRTTPSTGMINGKSKIKLRGDRLLTLSPWLILESGNPISSGFFAGSAAV